LVDDLFTVFAPVSFGVLTAECKLSYIGEVLFAWVELNLSVLWPRFHILGLQWSLWEKTVVEAFWSV
jgi:hypothetical protein